MYEILAGTSYCAISSQLKFQNSWVVLLNCVFCKQYKLPLVFPNQTSNLDFSRNLIIFKYNL